ncbi:type II toxin-antitoxin system VapC family toxin [bacterium]|nr:type II toxin-antitoxin system VapC family toxin [bacterium]
MDSNIYIFAFGDEPAADCEQAIRHLTVGIHGFRLHLPRMVVDEVGRNLRADGLKLCHKFWRDMGCAIDEEEIVPIGIIKSYRDRGFKSGDAVIAAYCEHAKVQCLVSENRDFLALSKPLPFRVMKAATFLKPTPSPPET